MCGQRSGGPTPWWLVLLLLLATLSVATAGENTLSQKSYRVLQESQDLLAANQSGLAISRLQALVAETLEHPYEQAIALQALGNAYIAREEYAAAIPHLKRSVGLGTLPDEVQQSMRFNLAQLYMATDQLVPAIDLLQVWLKHAKPPTAEAYVMLGSAQMQLKRYGEAIISLRTAIDLSSSPKESWFQNLLAAYNEVEDYPHCVELLHVMIQRFPNRPGYWRQLSGIELMRERYAEALAIMELAYLNGHLETERDLLNLVQLYNYLNAPFKAAQLLEKEMASGQIGVTRTTLELVSNAWYQSKEHDRSIATLERLVRMDSDPELGIRLSQLYVAMQRWKDAESVLQRMLEKSRMKDAQKARIWLLLGIARFEQNEPDGAKTAFLYASQHPASRSNAEQWLAYLQREARPTTP